MIFGIKVTVLFLVIYFINKITNLLEITKSVSHLESDLDNLEMV